MSDVREAPDAPGAAPHVVVVGAGLAGCEAAHQATRLGARVTLYEMKPDRYSPAHTSPDFAELVCSNSLRANSMAASAIVNGAINPKASDNQLAALDTTPQVRFEQAISRKPEPACTAFVSWRSSACLFLL